MPNFEQNQGTNLKLKSASRSGTERSEILNNGSTQRIKTLFNESFSLTVTPHFASFLTELGHELYSEKCTPFKTERFESLKSFSKHNG